VTSCAVICAPIAVTNAWRANLCAWRWSVLAGGPRAIAHARRQLARLYLVTMDRDVLDGAATIALPSAAGTQSLIALEKASISAGPGHECGTPLARADQHPLPSDANGSIRRSRAGRVRQRSVNGEGTVSLRHCTSVQHWASLRRTAQRMASLEDSRARNRQRLRLASRI
jgi:hypothetical protein